MEKLLFFIFMPIVYEGISFVIASNGWEYDNRKARLSLYSILLTIDYLIELIYLMLCKNVLGFWIIDGKQDDLGAFSWFCICALIYIFFMGVFSAVFSLCSDNIPIIHTIILIVLFIISCFMEIPNLYRLKDEAIFNEMPYEVNEKTIYLKPIEDNSYLKGEISQGYIVYYAYLSENGETIIHSFVYGQNTNIYEEGTSCVPRIIIKNYSKHLDSFYGDFNNEYSVWDIYIPSLSGT